jgi:septum site-determining protein MinC
MNPAEQRMAGEMPTPERPPVQIKGRGQGLRVSVARRCDPATAASSLRRQLEQRSGSFFGDAKVVLEFGSGSLDLALTQSLAAVLEEAGLRLIGVVTPEALEQPPERPERPSPERAADAAWIVAGHLRGGQRIHHAGSVVVLGDVNPGAEVLAGEHVLVWGRLRGVVEAGLAREPDAVDDIRVCALDLAPTQLRIGDAVARAPEEPDRVPSPEVARAVDGRIVVDGWR